MGVIQVDESQLEALVERELAKRGITTKAVSSTPSFAPGHGSTGIFAAAGADPQVFNAMQLPGDGIEAILPEYPTDLETPIYEIVTGQTATTGSEPSTPCGDWPEAGLTKLCAQVGNLSKQGRQSKVIDLATIGQRRDRADMMDYELIGDPLANAALGNIPKGVLGAGSPSDFLNNEIAKAMREVRVAFARDFARDPYEANPSNNVGTGRLYYRGFDLLINTGYQDYLTGTACKAADSIVESFGNLNISSNGAAMVNRVVDMWRRLSVIDEETGMNPVKRAIAMTRELFYVLTAVWPCSYLTNNCQVASANTQQQVDARDQTNMRDQMRGGKFLWIDGEQVPVRLDTAIRRTEVTPGTFRSQIYFIPLTARGGVPVTFKRFFDYSAPGAAQGFLSRLGNLAGFFAVTDNGKFLWSFDKNNTCIQLQAISRQTLVLRAPYLAARLTNILYTPLQTERSWDPADPYFVNGGATSRTAPSYYPPTA